MTALAPMQLGLELTASEPPARRKRSGSEARDHILDVMARNRRELIAIADIVALQVERERGYVTTPMLREAMEAAGHGALMATVVQ